RGQRFALPTTQTFDHNYTASYYLHELRTPESYRGDNYSDAGGAHTGMDPASFMICSRASISKMTATDCASGEFMDFVPKFCHEAMTR
ncbi:hypothetical protein, partial [Paracidovorax citrulli]|uniref:hypothetical protein n=1 Tax=Paracidovorax citrulli TaxID=80869 RepID=UPI003FA7C807